MTSLNGRVAIVTGVGRGMGRAIAIKLAKSGAATMRGLYKIG
jgi:NAD(P)-dependent dehydrogenase (short-subunit alcohol dehydrogenase family)